MEVAGMKVRRVPLRKCVACQQMIGKRELIRVVRTPQGEILIDPTGKKSGRGAYLCGEASCFRQARKSKALERALKSPVPEEIYDRLEQEFIRPDEGLPAGREADRP